MHLRLLSILALAGTAAFAQTKPTYTFPIKALSAEEELKTIQLPDGYSLELVLSDPIIKEPTAIAFDGNGKMYIVEMRTYMQDIDGTDELTPKSRISPALARARPSSTVSAWSDAVWPVAMQVSRRAERKASRAA